MSSPPSRGRRPSSARSAAAAGVAACAALAAAVATVVGAAAPSHAAAARRIGLVVVTTSSEAGDAAAAFLGAPWPATDDVVFLERRIAGAPGEAREAVARLAQDGVDAIALIDDDGAAARPVVHGCAVIAAAPTAPVAAADTAVRVRGGLLPGELRDAVARLAGDARRIGFVTRRDDDDAIRTPRAGEGPFVTFRPAGDTPRERGEDVRSRLVPRCDVVWVAPDLTSEDVGALAAALEGTGIPLVGSRAAHLDAGAAVVLRSAPRDVGRLTAALVLATTADTKGSSARGAAPAAPARLLREVHLGNARRLSFAVPLPFLATADRIVPAPAVRK